MKYHLTNDDSDLPDALRRIAGQLLSRAEAELRSTKIDDKKRVHQLRKRMKKLRGLVRLVRPAFKPYRSENAAFRDASRHLSELRDADVLIATYDAVSASLPPGTDRRPYAPIRRVLTWRSKAIWSDADLADRFAAYAAAATEAGTRLPDWTLPNAGFKGAAGGLEKTYRRARTAMAAAKRDRSEPVMHEWRKRVKYHWYHARLLTPMAPEVIGPHSVRAGELSELLGDHHDLAVLDHTLDAVGERSQAADIAGFRRALHALQDQLAADAFDLGRDVLGTGPRKLVARWRPYWKTRRAGADGGLLQARA